MLATAHMLAGASMGRSIRPAWLALPVAFASHFALDVIPHLDSHALFGAPGGPTRGEVTMAALDTLAGIALVLVLTWRLPHRGLSLAAAFFGIAPDLDNLPVLGTWMRASPLTPYVAWHHAIQHNVTPADWMLGFGTQAVVVLVAAWFLLRPTQQGETTPRASTRRRLRGRNLGPGRGSRRGGRAGSG